MESRNLVSFRLDSIERMDAGEEVGVGDVVMHFSERVLVREGREERDVADVQIGLFFGFTEDDFFEAFAEISESAGDSIGPLSRLPRSFHDEKLSRVVEDEGSSGACRIEVEREVAVLAAEAVAVVQCDGGGAAPRAEVEMFRDGFNAHEGGARGNLGRVARPQKRQSVGERKNRAILVDFPKVEGSVPHFF